MTDLPPHVEEVLAVARDGHVWGDEWTRRELAKAEQVLGETVCNGCTLAGCCKQPVMATYVEALPIAVQLHNSALNLPRIRQRYVRLGNRMEQAMARGVQDDELFPCPFLKDARCSVYSVRPMICRVYQAFGDAKRCTPYAERRDGERPKQQLLDHASAIGPALSVAMSVAEDLGGNRDLPWIRALPLQVAYIMFALQETPDGFLSTVFRLCHMPLETFNEVVQHQAADPLDRVHYEVP
jgi:Fe-S-cluster containining protein